MRSSSPFQSPQRSGVGPGARGTQLGVTLLQLTVMLAALIALVVALSYKTSDYFAKSQVLDSDALLRLADNQLRQYVAANGRLPCPALDGSGIAPGTCDSTQQKGYLPYITLGMAENNYVYGEVPILYGVYNDGTINLADTAQIFFPTYADKTNTSQDVTTQRNIFDFCASLEAMQAQTGVNSAGLSMAGQYNAVFALALPGKANRDGLVAGWSGGPSINAQYDGLNALSATQFELPETPVGPTYDDRTAFRGPTDMHDYLRCEAMNNSISLLADAVTIQKEVEDLADSNSDDATKGIVLNAVGIALVTWEVIQDIAAISEASEQIGIASGLLASASATCPIPPWVTCALIPVYATAVTSASIGLGLAIGAAVSAGIGLGLEITATVLYADLKSRTSTAPPDPSPPNAGITGDRLTTLKTNYATSKAAAQTAFNAIPALVPNVPALNTAQTNAASTLASNISGVGDSTLRAALSNDLNGSSSTCNLGSVICLAAGYTARDVPQMGTDYTFVKPDGTLDTCTDTPTVCQANGYTQTIKDVIYSKANQNGTTSNCDMTVPGHDAAWCLANGYSGAGTPHMTQIFTKDLLAGTPYSPGVIPSIDTYYAALAQAGTNASPALVPADSMNASNTVVHNYSFLLIDIYDFDVNNLAYWAAVSWQNARYSDYSYWFNVVNHAAYCYNNPGDAGNGCTAQSQAAWLSDYNAYLPNYNAALTAYNNAVTSTNAAATARSNSLSTLQTQMGDPTWNYTGSTSLCGGGSTSGCGWMNNSSPASGNSTTPATTGSGVVNAYLTAYEAYKNADDYKRKKAAADSAATSAWSDRNGFKTALCAVVSPTPVWLGGGTPSSTNPGAWDSPENLPAASWSPTGTSIATSVTNAGAISLSCTGSASPVNTNSQNAAASAAEQAKYCTVGGPSYDANLCALYSGASATRSTVQGAQPIVDELIQRGIVR